MTEVKTITAREISQIASTFYEQPKYIIWHGKRIKVQPLLTFEEVFHLVDAIMSVCIDPENKVIIFESVDFVTKCKLLEAYANIHLPNGLDDQYNIIYGSDLVEFVLSNVNQNQLYSIKNTISAYTGVCL